MKGNQVQFKPIYCAAHVSTVCMGIVAISLCTDLRMPSLCLMHMEYAICNYLNLHYDSLHSRIVYLFEMRFHSRSVHFVSSLFGRNLFLLLFVVNTRFLAIEDCGGRCERMHE